MVEAGSYDLLSRRKPGWKPIEALIVSPYVEAEFFRRIARDLRPKRLHVVIDDGSRREDRQTVLDAVAGCGHRRPPALALKLGSARGLVHIKLFYVRWRTPGGQRAHSLVFGSANATRQGFSGFDNAELVAACDLTASAHREVIDWCARVIDATLSGDEIEVCAVSRALLARGMHLRLPAITVGREVSTVSNFDLWLQRGFLLSAYRPDPAFLRVVVPLSQALPPAEQARLAMTVGFEVQQTRSVRYRYVDDGSADEPTDDEAGEPQEIGNWRRKLFTWTHLGEWCSEECFQCHERDFKRRNHERREAALEQLKGLADIGARAAAREAFLSKMDALWAAFGNQASAILRGGREVDRRHYAKVFNDRVDRDLEMIEDEEFLRRYVTGFEFVPVPRFRNDVVGWRRFVDSLGRQLALDGTRGRSQSKLLAALRDAAEGSEASETGALRDARSLIAFMRAVWRRDAGRRDGPAYGIAHYHERGP